MLHELIVASLHDCDDQIIKDKKQRIVEQSMISRGLGGKGQILGGGFGDPDTYNAESGIDGYIDDVVLKSRKKGRSSSRRDNRYSLAAHVSLKNHKKLNKTFTLDNELMDNFSSLINVSLCESDKRSLKESLIISNSDNTVKINAAKWRMLTFDVRLHASLKMNIEYELAIVENDDVMHVYRGVETPDGVVVRLPPLNKLISAGYYKTVFRVVLNRSRVIETITFVSHVSNDEKIDESFRATKKLLSETMLGA